MGARLEALRRRPSIEAGAIGVSQTCRLTAVADLSQRRLGGRRGSVAEHSAQRAWCSLQVRKVSMGTVSSAQPRYVTLLMWPFMSMSERRATCETIQVVNSFVFDDRHR